MRRILAAALLVSGLIFPASVFAAGSSAPVMEMQVWPDTAAGQVLVIVSATVPGTTRLPATVRIPLIDGMAASWAGEIADGEGADVQHDIAIHDGTAGKYVEVPLKSFRTAQIEMTSALATATGTTVSAQVDFVQTVPSRLTAFSVRLPAGVKDGRITPAPTGTPAKNSAGETLYTLPSAELKTGGVHTVKVSFAPAGQQQTSTTDSSGSGAVLGVLLGGLAVAVVALAVVLGRQRASRMS